MRVAVETHDSQEVISGLYRPNDSRPELRVMAECDRSQRTSGQLFRKLSLDHAYLSTLTPAPSSGRLIHAASYILFMLT